MDLIGRKEEQLILKHCYQSTQSRLVAIYGRRRIGKTFLVRKYFDHKIRFEVSGLYRGNMSDQLAHFSQAIARAGFVPASLTPPATWMSAFSLLALYLDQFKDGSKKIIFIDELPWFDTPRSKFLMAFENFWNEYCSRRNDVMVIICGSAASWMIKKIMNNKGGLHNRVSEKIHLAPFTLAETEKFLIIKGIRWSQYDIAQLYMTTGGIPYYLDAIRKGESVTQFIDRACFTEQGVLYAEYENLYDSLFAESEHHRSVVALLAGHKQGLLRDQIIQKTKLRTGGTMTKILDELEKTGFISTMVPFGKNKNKALYKLNDFFSLFYFKFMARGNKRMKNEWSKIVTGSSWQSWSGLAFERLCFAHIPQIKNALGLSVIQSAISCWQSQSIDEGAQIDMIIDRSDGVINACEIKFSKTEFVIDKAYAKNLRNKLSSLETTVKKKNIFLTMISTFGTADNEYYKELVQSEVTLEDLFRE